MSETKKNLLVNLIRKSAGLSTDTSGSCCSTTETGKPTADSGCSTTTTGQPATDSCCSTTEKTKKASDSCC